MSSNTAPSKPTKIGRPTAGDAPMTSAERMRRTRERRQASGAKEFQMQVQGMHLAYVEQLALRGNVSTGVALRMLLEPALDRYVCVMQRCERMKENGATDEQVAVFIHTYLMPELPPMPERNGQ